MPIVNNLFLLSEQHSSEIKKNAKSDGANMLDLAYLEKLLTNLVTIRKTINNL